MAETESKQSTKQCCQCGFANLSVAKFCIECGERFAASIAANRARDSNAISPTANAASPAARLDPLAALDRFLGSQTSEDAAARLKSAVDGNRARLKTLGVPLPKATNPILVSLMESLKALPSNEISARIAIVTALGRMGNPAVLPPLLLVTGAQSRDVRKVTAIALGCIRHPLSAYLLLPMLQDGSSRVRQTAFQALVQLNQPHTAEAILAACLGSRSLRSVILETLRLITNSKRSSFFQLLSESNANQQPDLKIVADWLRFEVRNAIAESSPLQATNNAAVATQPTPAPLPQKMRPQKEKPVPQPVAVGADSQSSESNVFGWGNAEEAQSTPASGAASTHRYSTRTNAAVANESRTADRYEMTLDFDEDDDYESDVRLIDDGNGSAADLKFFNSISEYIPDTEDRISDDDVDDDDRSELEFASHGSQASMSLSSMLAAPEIPAQSSDQRSRPAARSSHNGNRPSAFRGYPEHGSPESAPPAGPFSAYDTATTTGNTPGLNMPFTPMMHPAATSADGMFPPATHSGKMSAASAFDMTASSPLIPAFHSSATQSVAFTATTSAAGQAGSDVSSTVHQSSTTSGVTHLELSGDDEESIDEIEAARALATAAHEKALARLSAAREEAFRKLLEDAEEIPKTLPRLLRKRVSALMATPSTEMDRIIEQLHKLGATNSPAALSTLASFCHKPAKQVREACAEAIGCIAHPGSAVLLLKLLADKSGTVAEAALKALAKIDLEPARPVLLAAGLCGTSLKTVVTVGIEATSDDKKSEWKKFLLEVLRRNDTNLAAFAVSLLSRIAGDTHLEIFQKLATHETPILRAAAVEALARTQAKRAISQINAALEDVDPTVRAQAAMSVATMYSPRSVELLQKLVFDSNLTVRRNAAQSMSRIDESDLADVITRALDLETDATTVEYLLAALQRNGANSSLSVLQRYIEGDSPQFRELAVKALRKLKIPASVPVFRRLLDDHTPGLRRQAIEQLAVLKCEGILPRLREMLKQDPDETVRSACARALGDFGDESSVNLLEEALEDHPLIRLQAVIALGRLGQASAGPILLSLMRDQLPEVRYQAVRAVAQLKLEGCEESIQELMNDRDEMVRRGAEQSLQDLGMTPGQIRRKKMFRQVASVASRLAPSAIAGVVPGGSKSLLAILLLMVSTGAFWGIWSIVLLAGGGEKLPMTTVVGVAVSPKTQQAFILRNLDILDVWSLADTTLTGRFKIPAGTTQIIPEANGSLLLLHPAEGIRQLDPKVNFSPEGAKLVAFDGPVGAVFMETQSNSLCLFENAAAGTQLRILDAATLQEKSKISLPVQFKGNCIVSPDMKYAAMLQTNGSLTLVDTVSLDVVEANVANMAKIDSLDMVFAIQFSSDMKYFCFGGTKGFFAIQIDEMSLVKHVQDAGGCVFIQALPGSSNVLALAEGSVLEFKDEFKTMSTVPVPTLATFNYMDPEGKMIISAADEQKEVQVFDMQEKTSVQIPPNE